MYYHTYITYMTYYNVWFKSEKWYNYERFMPKWGKTPRYHADKPHNIPVTSAWKCLFIANERIRPPPLQTVILHTYLNITLIGSPYGQIGRIKATLSYLK